MPKKLEYFNHWYDGILNSFPFCLDDKYVKTIAVAWGFTEQGKWKWIPRLCLEEWQYVNAVFSVRFGLPFAFFMQVRWSSSRTAQFGIGWKESGRFAIHCRFQTDASAAAGYHAGMPNTDQAQGFEYGRH
jgi:hypothetical protein